MNTETSGIQAAIAAIKNSCKDANFKWDLMEKVPAKSTTYKFKARELAGNHPVSDFGRFYGKADILPTGSQERVSAFNITNKALLKARTELELELVHTKLKEMTINGRSFDELSRMSESVASSNSNMDISTSLSRVNPSVARISNPTPALETIQEPHAHRDEEHDQLFLLRYMCEELDMLKKDIKEIKFFLKNK
jgi:hypothetical protein